jgi:hypothetical protein
MSSSRPSLAARATREIYRRELLPPRALWWLAAAGMRDWYRVLAKQLAAPLLEAGAGESRALLADLSRRMFERRWDALVESGAKLPERSRDARALALLMGALYRTGGAPKAAWIFDGVGGPAKGPAEQLRARLLLAKLDARERWYEVATHLGELLVVLTEDLPAHLPHARKILGDVCFRAGARYAERVKKAFGMRDVPDPPRAAMEILRMSEYVFRVNPEHWSGSDGTSGWLEGTACPWWSRPGWNGAHCGIFGQFQSGIASVFGLRYHLSKTIPKHGGHTCRIDVKPIAPVQLKRSKDGRVVA